MATIHADSVVVHVKNYIEHGVQYREELVPDGWVVIETYDPHSSPWDYYCRKWERERLAVMRAAGINAMVLTIHRHNTIPMGSGPGGRVRFGDAMMPSTYKLIVRADHEFWALLALNNHKRQVQEWLAGLIPMPAACGD